MESVIEKLAASEAGVLLIVVGALFTGFCARLVVGRATRLIERRSHARSSRG